MLLALDIGNTNTEIGLFPIEKITGELIAQFRIESRKTITTDELGILIKSFLYHSQIDYKKIKGIICSSVVPPMNHSMSNMALRYFGLTANFVGHEIETGLSFKYPNPSEIGADRIVNAVAVNEIYGGPAIIVDFGTATTFCVLSERGEYLGGAITPGINSSIEVLTSKTAKLPKIELLEPESVLGQSTISAMRSGVYFSALDAMEGIIRRLIQELKLDQIKVIATGGFARMISQGTSRIDIVDTHLTLKGLDILYHKNLSQFESSI